MSAAQTYIGSIDTTDNSNYVVFMQMLGTNNIVFGLSDGNIQIYSIESQAFTCTAQFLGSGKTSPFVRAMSVLNSKEFAACYEYGIITVWNVKCEQVSTTNVDGAPDLYALYIMSSTELAVGTINGDVWLFKPPDTLTSISSTMNAGSSNIIYSLVFNGTYLVSGDSAGYITFWIYPDYTNNGNLLIADGNYVVSMVFYTNYLAVAAGKNIFIVTLSEKNVYVALTLTGHGSEITCLAYASGQLFSGSSDSTVMIWDASNGGVIERNKFDTSVYSLLLLFPSNINLLFCFNI
jgi:WD40 repeat protein